MKSIVSYAHISNNAPYLGDSCKLWLAGRIRGDGALQDDVQKANCRVADGLAIIHMQFMGSSLKCNGINLKPAPAMQNMSVYQGRAFIDMLCVLLC